MGFWRKSYEESSVETSRCNRLGRLLVTVLHILDHGCDQLPDATQSGLRVWRKIAEARKLRTEANVLPVFLRPGDSVRIMITSKRHGFPPTSQALSALVAPGRPLPCPD